jgi:cbb3-type cytochrome oxidase cytochrome c subunit
VTTARTALLVTSVGGIGFFVMSIFVLGVWPGRVLEEETQRMSPAHPLKLTPSEQRGREIYSREGCAYCHTQQVRFLDRDIQRFGKPTLAWETRFDYPHLWGTRRIGPDLSRESSIRSDDWQLAHLYNPRNIVPDSVMPPFPGYFDGAPDRPLQSARDVLAYLKTLGRARELAEPANDLNASASAARREGKVPQFDPAAPPTSHAAELYKQNCAGCHGPNFEGDGPGASGLSPHPANLSEHQYTQARLAVALWNGIAGSAMPAWRDFSTKDLAEIASVVRKSSKTSPEPTPPQQIIDLGRQVYADRCAPCHGENGAGDGPGGREISMLPTDFTAERPSPAESLRALRNGVEGTPMAPWNTKLSEAELSAVAYYVRSFFKPDR